MQAPPRPDAAETAPVDTWWDQLAEADGLVLRERVFRAGVEPDLLVVALRTGRLVRVQRGVYTARATPAGPLARARAAILSSGVVDAVASHATAGRVHQLHVPGRPRVEHVTVRRELRRIHRRDLQFHGRAIGLGEVVAIGGVSLTSRARTVFDLATVLPELDAVWCADDALRRGLVTRVELIEQGARHARGGGPAAARIAAADGMAESALETAGRLALAAAGVRLPEPQHEVRDGTGRLVARVDGAYPELRLALELDGASVHSAPEAVFRDRRRQNELHLLGWRVLRFTWWDVVHDPARFVATVRAALVSTAA